MLPDRVSNPGPLTYESGALPIALRGPALMFWLLVITFDTLLIKLMQTAQLIFNGRTFTEFFAVLFLFRGIPMSWKGPRPAELSAIRNLLGSVSVFLGALWCYKWATQYTTLYRAINIRDQLYVWNFFFINNGRHRTTALYLFPRLSVRGITALQCIIWSVWVNYTH